MNKYIMIFLLLPSLARAAAVEPDLNTMPREAARAGFAAARQNMRHGAQRMYDENGNFIGRRYQVILPGGRVEYVWDFRQNQNPHDPQ